MIRTAILILFQSLVVYYVFPAIHQDFRVQGGFGNAVLVILLFVILNWILRTLFVIFTLGIGLIAYYLTLGILGLVANAFVLILIDEWFRDLLTVPSYGIAFLGGFALAIINFIVESDDKKKE